MFSPDSFSLSLIVGKWVSDVAVRLITLGPAQPRHVLPNHIKQPWSDVGRYQPSKGGPRWGRNTPLGALALKGSTLAVAV